MKKLIFTSFIAAATFAQTHAQNPVNDSATLGAGYAKQTYYSLANGTKTTIDKTSWDIGFSVVNMDVTIITNYGVTLWKSPVTNVDSAWNNTDTVGIDAWTKLYNSDTTWENGAFNQGANGFDYGWGTYSMTTHKLTGNSVFIIKLHNGDYKKIIIREMNTTGVYTIEHANIDGTNAITKTINKADYPNKNFVHYSISTDQLINQEPNTANWDLLFTQYYTLINAGTSVVNYGVSGVLTNKNTEIIKAENVNATNYVDYTNHTFTSQINTIGYDWKTYSNGTYVIADSTVYFVKDQANDIWKVLMTGFGGSSTGDVHFSTLKLTTTDIKNAQQSIGKFSVYPNPAFNQPLHVVYELQHTASATTLRVYNVLGQVIYNTNLENSTLNQITIPTNDWTPGNYILEVMNQNGHATQQVIIK